MSEQRYDPDVLARRLDQALPPHKSFIPPITPDPLVNSAAAIAKLSLPSLSRQASSRIEVQMLAAFDEQYSPHIVKRSRRRTPTLLSWALIASLALVVLLVGLTPALAASLPGEPLYTVKQLYEAVELSTATTSAAKANVYLIHADRRSQEALTLLERNKFDPSLVTEALSNIAQAGESANDVRASARLRGQVLEVNTLVSFVVRNAKEKNLVSSSDAAPLDQQVMQIAHSDLLLPLPDDVPDARATQTPTLTATPTATPSPTEEVTETLSPEPGASGDTPICEHGQSCISQGVPGGQVVPPTQKPTIVHRNTPPPPQATPGGGSSNGSGNSNGGGNSAGGNSSGGDSGGSGNGNSGGNGKGGG